MEIDAGDIIANIRLFTREEGGRESETPSDRLACMFEYEGQLFDCWVLLETTGPLKPGTQARIPIRFAFPELIIPRVNAGSWFKLKDYRTIAEGTVEEVISKQTIKSLGEALMRDLA